jgi:xanthine dehydrogenase FAD-binding subunit
MRYHSPTSFAEAAALAAAGAGTTRFLAGGTDVLVQLRAGMITPDDLIDLKKIPGVKDITATADGGWRIGAAVSGAELGRHESVLRDWPGVVEGMRSLSARPRCRAAHLAGNLCNGSPAADSVPGMVAAGAKRRGGRHQGQP